MSSAIEQLLSIDLGRTATKACISMDPDAVVVIPANVQQLSVEDVRQGFSEDDADPLLDMWLEYQGQGYAIGQLAADFGANLGLGKRKVEDALIKVFAAAGYFDLANQTIGIVLGLPYMSQHQFDQEKSEVVALLQGTHRLQYRTESFQFEIAHVWVIPEGYGSLILCETQNKERGIERSLVGTSVAVIDIGYQTTDFLIFDRFRFARGASMSEEFAMAQFYEQLVDRVPGADSQSLTLIEVVNRAAGERLYRPRGATLTTDLDTILPEVRSNFARDLYNHMIAWLPERTQDVVITGGGGGFFCSGISSTSTS